MNVNWLALAIAAVVVAGAAAIAAMMITRQDTGRGPEFVPIGGNFTLTSHEGKRVSDPEFRGKLMLVYFGYTYCPDVCPSELQVMGSAIDHLGGKADEVTPIFITVDPQRDDWQALGEYVPHFHDRMVGLTGTPDEIAAVAKAYRVYFAKAESEDDEAYLMDHTSLVYLMARDGQYLRHFTGGTTAEEMAAAISEEF